MPDFTWWAGGQVDFLDTPDGRVAYRHWPRAADARRTLLGIHGVGGNNDNFIALGEALQPGTAVYAIDLCGNGQSGTPGDVTGFDVHLRNLDALAAHIRSLHPDAGHFAAGFSLGAAYAAAWIARGGFEHDGLILLAPPFHNRLTPPAALNVLFRLMATLRPTSRIALGPRANDYIDPRYAFVSKDPRFIRTRTLRSLKIAADAVPAGERALRQVRVPALIVHGDADVVALPDGAQLAFDRLASADKTLRWIPGARHDLFDVTSGAKNGDVTDTQRQLVIGPIREWLESH